MPFRLTQVTFRARNDDGSEAAATWKATAGSDWTQLVDTNFRVRFRLDETGGTAWTNKTFNLRYSLNGGAYTAVGTGQPVIFASSGNFAQGDDCTEQLTGGTGTFIANNNGMCESAGAINSGTGGYLFEVEFCIQIAGASVSHNDTINLRIYDGNSAINTYTDTPVITVSKPVDLTANGVDAGAPSLGAPAIGQIHALAASGIATGAPELGSPALTQPVNLTANDLIAGTPALGTPAIGQAHALASGELAAGAPTAGSPAITQAHALNTSALAAGAPALDTPALGQEHALEATGIATGSPTLGVPALIQAHNLAADGLASGDPTLGTPTLTENEGGVDHLIADDLAMGAPTLGAPAIGQIHALMAGELTAGVPALDSPEVMQFHALVALALSAGAPSLGSPVLAEHQPGEQSIHNTGMRRGFSGGIEKEMVDLWRP